MKKHASSNISTNQCNFLANKAVSLLVCFTLIYTSHLKENFTIVYFPLKNMSLQIQDVKSFNNFFEERWYLRNDNLFLNLPDIKVYFFWTESIATKTFLKKTINIANNYLHHSRAVLDSKTSDLLILLLFRKSIHRTLHLHFHMLLPFMYIIP